MKKIRYAYQEVGKYDWIAYLFLVGFYVGLGVIVYKELMLFGTR